MGSRLSIFFKLFVASATSHVSTLDTGEMEGRDTLKEADTTTSTTLLSLGNRPEEDIRDTGRENFGSGKELGDGDEEYAGPAHLSWDATV